jgi:hypothetical protein
MPFQYHTRTKEEMETRLRQSGRGNFISFIKGEYRLFQPGRGESCIRIMPMSPNAKYKGHWGIDVNVHYQVGPEKGSVICLDHAAPQIGPTGGACPICQEMYKARRANDEELARSLRPTKRVLTFLLNRKDQGQGVLIWAMPQTLDETIQRATKSREDGTFKLVDHPEKGYDVYFDKTGEQMLTKYEGVQLASNPSRVEERYLQYVEDNPLDECLVWRDAEEVRKVFEGGVNAAAGDDEPRPRAGYDRPRPGNDRPPRDDDRYARPREEHPRYASDDYPASDRRRASDDRVPPPHEEERGDPPWNEDRNPPREEPAQEPERHAEPDPEATNRPIRRPGSAPRGNGAASPEQGPANVGKARADELRAQFLSGRK